VRLELHNLKSLTRVEVNDGSSLRELQMDTCGKASLVKANRGIRMLGIDKCAPIPNLAFIADLPELELFGFGDVVDGNLQPILDHPRIRHVQMENRRHYSHTDAQIDVVMRQRRRALGYPMMHIMNEDIARIWSRSFARQVVERVDAVGPRHGGARPRTPWKRGGT